MVWAQKARVLYVSTIFLEMGANGPTHVNQQRKAQNSLSGYLTVQSACLSL